MNTTNPGRRHMLASGIGLPLAALFGAGGLGACHRPEPLVRVASNAWVGYVPLFLSRELGHFKDDVSDLRLLEMPSNTASLMALASDQIEAAALTLDEFLVAREGQLDLRVILMFDESAGADLVVGHPRIQGLKQLRGQRVGVEDTATGALVLTRALETAGLQPSDVTKVSLSGPMQVESYAKGLVDAVVCFEPYATQLAKLGARRLIDSSSLPGVIVDVLVARKSALDASPERFRHLVAAQFQALSMLQRSPVEATTLVAPSLGIDAQELAQALQGVRMISLSENHALLDGEAPRLRPMAQSVSLLMQRSGLLKAEAALDHLADARFLPAV